MYEASGKDGITLKLNSPITEEQWDAITDVDFENTDKIWFITKHRKTVEFMKRKKGKWNKYYHGINEIPSFTYSCNQCGYSAPYGLYGGKYSQKEWNFCPSCGADMRGEQE